MPGATTSLHHPLVQTPISAESGRAGLQDCRRRASHSRSASVRLDQRGWGGGQPGLHDRARSPPHRSGQCRHRLPRPRTCGNGAYRLCRSVPRRETGHIEQWGPDRKGRTRASVRSPVDGAAKRCRDLDARRRRWNARVRRRPSSVGSGVARPCGSLGTLIADEWGRRRSPSCPYERSRGNASRAELFGRTRAHRTSEPPEHAHRAARCIDATPRPMRRSDGVVRSGHEHFVRTPMSHRNTSDRCFLAATPPRRM